MLSDYFMKIHHFFFIFLFLSFICLSAVAPRTLDWGRTGHRTIGEIAENHLSRKAKRNINKLLNERSLAFVSTYADELYSDNKYRKYSPWHYVQFPFESTYEVHPKNEKGDIIVAIHTCIKVLKNQNSTHEEKVFHLKMLIHFIGDLHQPLHTGLAEDRGGNKFQVLWFNEKTNLHSVWDTKMIESYNMSYTELAANTKRLSKKQIQDLQKGSITDWMYESRKIFKDIYSNTKVGEKLGYRYMYDYLETVWSQLQKGGIRLAAILNDIFG